MMLLLYCSYNHWNHRREPFVTSDIFSHSVWNLRFNKYELCIEISSISLGVINYKQKRNPHHPLLLTRGQYLFAKSTKSDLNVNDLKNGSHRFMHISIEFTWKFSLKICCLSANNSTIRMISPICNIVIAIRTE